MPVFALTEDILFPPAHLADRSGLVAVGGDLSPARLLAAYRQGIFPWYGEGDPLLWWSPHPRFVLTPRELHISGSLRALLRKNAFAVTFDRDFPAVIAACGRHRPGRDETWITPEMREAYLTLHELGYAHSVEAWQGENLVGGLYGVSLGRCFFGESMFTEVSNASKAAFVSLVERLGECDFTLIDCQVFTRHLQSLGARMIARKTFLNRLRLALAHPTLRGNWGERPGFIVQPGNPEAPGTRRLPVQNRRRAHGTEGKPGGLE
ncbi:MAG TPA: leucyl/phenylalanyl-tRNA--protein transferase [Syntrophales bacterium]|nr:leucyl/phenylalanyl-tRNA--protein transferase [Syntrophales bacterium]